MPLVDIEIKKLAEENEMIHPFTAESINNKDGKKIPSYGLSSMGYDVKLQNKFSIYNPTENLSNQTIDIMNSDSLNYKEIIKEGVVIKDVWSIDTQTNNSYLKKTSTGFFRGKDFIIIPPGGFVLSVTEEYFKMPDDVLAKVYNKSTWARIGLNVLTTVIEPGWEGEIVIEIQNISDQKVKLYAGMGIAQLVFERSTLPPEVSYGKRNGKYQGQTGITIAKV